MEAVFADLVDEDGQDEGFEKEFEEEERGFEICAIRDFKHEECTIEICASGRDEEL